MLILATGDHHFDEGARWPECLRIHTWIAERVEELRPALVLGAGDLYERASTPVVRAAVAEWLTRVAAVCPVLLVKGNHDRAHDCELLARLRTKYPVIVEEAAGVHVLGDVAVGAFAWPSRAMLAAALGDAASPETVAQAGREALRLVLGGLSAQLAAYDGPRILLGHAHVVGARVGLHGQPLAPGADITCGLEDLALANADAVVLGHIHAPQDWTFGGTSIAYTGSPFRNTFGEAEEKSILALHIGNARSVELERIPTPCSPMLLLEAEYAAPADADPHGDHGFTGALGWHESPPDDVTGAEIRLRYEVASDKREAARRCAEDTRAELLSRGAAIVKLDEVVIATTTARAPEITNARTTWEQVESWAQRHAVSEERFPELRTKLATIEETAA